MKAQLEAFTSPGAEPRPGVVLAGKYRVERVLGKGGMGLVMAATHLQLDQKVAIKMILPHSARNPEVVARFDREAKATTRIQSEHVVKVLDVGRFDDGSPFMVMEYLEGCDLAAALQARGPLPLGDAVEYVLQACEALAEAHRLGIIHRDLKPANLFLAARADGSPVVKVLDFGISKASLSSAAGAMGLTQDMSMMGSPNYMSPEQIKNSKDVDARADIWSLGATLYELLAGEVAFKAETLAELHVAILQSFPSSLLARRPDLPPDLEMVVLQCLHKDRNFRPASVAELAKALAAFAPAQAQISIERICRVMGVSAPSSTSLPSQRAWGATSAPATSPSAMPPPPSAQYAPVSAASMHPAGPWSQPHVAAPMVPAWGAAPQPPIWSGPAPGQQPLSKPGWPAWATVALVLIVATVVLGGASCVGCLILGIAL